MNERNFFAELKRRNVYKVAVAYAIVAWLLIQAASILFPTFEAPAWVMKVFITAIIAGFPVALILAWAFELTPEGIKRESEVAPNESITRKTGRKLAGITVALAVIAAGLFALQFSGWVGTGRRPVRAVEAEEKGGRASGASLPTQLPAAPDKSIAVLPFDNLSRDPDNAYFAEGIQDEILTRLAKIAELKVISRTSTARYKSSPENLREIAKQLGVLNILEGSVQRAGDQVRVNVQLINTTTDAHLWADIYDRKMTDIFAVESEIAKTVADTLQAKLTGSAEHVLASKPTENPEAHELYLKGRYLWNRRTGENLDKALTYFQQAIEKDPSYALAYAGLADCYGVMPDYLDRPPNEEIKRGIAAAQRAIELDGSLAEAHTALANVLMTDLQFAAAEAEFKRAFALNPNYASAHQWYGECLESLGRFPEALAELERARDLDPLSLIINSVLAAVTNGAGRTDEALRQVQRAVDLDPNFGVAYWVRGQILEDQGQFDQAIADYEKAQSAVPNASCKALIACVYARSGRSVEARAILNELIDASQRNYTSSYFLAEVRAMLGDKEEALRLLEKAYEERSIPVGGGGIGGPKTDKRLDSLRSDPRFQKLVAKFMGEAQ
jgi:TolB-like protein/Tfp pilus assembly protein PilF